MKPSSLLNFVLCVLAAALAPAAAAADAPAIYVVDMQRVVNQSIAGKAARSDLEAELKKRKAGIDRKQLELKNMQEALKRQSAVLSKAALEEKMNEFRKKEKEVRRAVMDESQDMARRNNALIDVIVREVQKLLKDLAAQRNAAFIVERGQHFVIYVDKRLDLTDEVIKLLDQRKLEL